MSSNVFYLAKMTNITKISFKETFWVKVIFEQNTKK